MNARDTIAHLLFTTDNKNASGVEAEWRAAGGKQLIYIYAMADALIAAGYVLADHTEYALDHKLSDLQFTDDDGELWTDEDDIKDYASEYGDTAPLVKRHVTAWEAAK